MCAIVAKNKGGIKLKTDKKRLSKARDFFSRRKSITPEKTAEEKAKIAEAAKSELETICGKDVDTYLALRDTMFLDPEKITETIEETAAKAEKFEKAGNTQAAKIWYKVAGGLAISQKDVPKVVRYFTKYQKLDPQNLCPILKNPENAVAKAQEYYKKHQKEERIER